VRACVGTLAPLNPASFTADPGEPCIIRSNFVKNRVESEKNGLRICLKNVTQTIWLLLANYFLEAFVGYLALKKDFDSIFMP